MAVFQSQVIALLAECREIERLIAATGGEAGPLQARRWSCASRLERLLRERALTALRVGIRDPDRPIELSFQDTCLLNFGTWPELLRLDLRADDASGTDGAASPTHGRCLGFMEMGYAESHASSGVYNLEPWLQEMYSDCLDQEHRHVLRERATVLRETLRAVPERLHALGVPDRLVTAIMAALRNYRGVKDQARAREQGKTSIVGARAHALALQRVEEAMARARVHVQGGAERADECSPLQDIFLTWKDALFELTDIEEQLRHAGGSNLGGKFDELENLLDAVWQTARRAAEERGHPWRGLLGAREALRICPRQVVEEEFEALLMYDIIGSMDLAAQRMETRRFGSLCALIVPGAGDSRYSTELRRLQASHLKQEQTNGRSYDLDRRINYPRNYIVIPSMQNPQDMLESLADAFLEYKALAFPVAYRELAREATLRFPEMHDDAGRRTRLEERRRLARYLAAFVRWAKYGRVTEELPRLDAFIAWVRGRMRRPRLLALPRYQCVLGDFADATPERRDGIFTRHLRERLELDRRLVCLHTIAGRIDRAIAWSRYLPAAVRANPYYKKGLEPAGDGGPWGKQNAERLFQRFILSEPALKREHASLEMRFFAELDTLRQRAQERLGRVLAVDEAAAAVARRLERMLLAQREQACLRIDRNLVGLLYCQENNFAAARDELEGYLARLEQQRRGRGPETMRFDGSTLERVMGWRGRRLDEARRAGKRQSTVTRVAGAGKGDMVHEDDFVYFNLGVICLELGDRQAASDYLSRFCLWAAQQNWHLFGECARELNEGLLSG